MTHRSLFYPAFQSSRSRPFLFFFPSIAIHVQYSRDESIVLESVWVTGH